MLLPTSAEQALHRSPSECALAPLAPTCAAAVASLAGTLRYCHRGPGALTSGSHSLELLLSLHLPWASPTLQRSPVLLPLRPRWGRRLRILRAGTPSLLAKRLLWMVFPLQYFLMR